MLRQRDKDRELLERELQTGGYQELLHRLQEESLFLRRFPTWEDVISLMRERDSDDPRKEDILRPIFQHHAKDRDPR